MVFFLILKLSIVLFFLMQFIRRQQLAWGIGLLATTTAVLLDTILGTFNRDEMLAQLGFFFYIIAGMLLGGMVVWAWSVLRPQTASPSPNKMQPHPPLAPSPPPMTAPSDNPSPNTSFDRQMMYDQIRQRLSREDILDLIFDLQLSENDVIGLNQDMQQVIVNLMDLAEQRGQTGTLALAVERILTPVPREHLPRLEKMDEDSPPTVWRQYLIAHYNLEQLQQLCTELALDWEWLGGDKKQTKIRELLLHLYRRNRIYELVTLLKPEPVDNSQ